MPDEATPKLVKAAQLSDLCMHPDSPGFPADFRAELTSIVTLKRPAERIDTLDELEDALDGGGMAPCVYENEATHEQLMADESDAVHGSLMRKLRSAFKIFGSEELITGSFSDCLACALRHDRVCYTLFEYPCGLREEVPEVREFREHFKIILSGLRVRKSRPLYEFLRRFFLAVEEGDFLHSTDAECSYNGTDAVFELDLSNLFMQHAMLLFASSAVLVVEVSIAGVRTSIDARSIVNNTLTTEVTLV
ncbi:hypothetical protein MTO96_016216 [Rhipicephalus appendiculatus]